jgi:hypothetical protein
MSVKKIIDFAKAKAILSPQDFVLVSEQRARNSELTKVLTTALPKIDIEHYRSVLSNQKLVAEVEKALKDFKPVKGNTSSALEDLKAQRQVAVIKYP